MSRSGYDWYGPRRQLVTFDTGYENPVWTYQPMREYPALFRTFAGLAPTEETFLGFAAQYGGLTDNVTALTPDKLGAAWSERLTSAKKGQAGAGTWTPFAGSRGPAEESLQDMIDFPGGVPLDPLGRAELRPTRLPETLSLWAAHHAEMGEAIQIWQDPTFGSREKDLGWVRRRILANLAGRVELYFEPRKGWLGHRPSDLISALWLQFGLAVGKNPKHKKCEMCDAFFEVSVVDPAMDTGRKVRSNKKYCSTKCQRDAAYAKKLEKKAGRRK